MDSVVVRTHGGLGNQLFQLLYARLYAKTYCVPLFEVHDVRYRHGFARSAELLPAARPSLPRRVISALRLPKIVTRLKRRCDAVKLFGTVYLDGYFQTVADYSPFDRNLLREELQRLRAELAVCSAPTRHHGVHLRLGDFFASDAAIVAHLHDRLDRIVLGAWIVTNDEERLAAPAIAPVLTATHARILPTGGMSAEQVLRTLASFRTVDGNDSTLLFWASVLSGMECRYRSPGLQALRIQFLNVLADDGGGV